MTTLEVLKAAKALLQCGWTQGVGARTSAGVAVGSHNPLATRFCALGALARTTPSHAHYCTVRNVLEQHLPPGTPGVMSYNDVPTTTYADILALFDRAIRHAKGAILEEVL